MAFETFAGIDTISGRNEHEEIAIKAAEANEGILRQLSKTMIENCRTMKWEEPKPTKVGDVLYEGEAPWIFDGAHLKIVDAGNGKADALVVIPALIDITIDLSDIKEGE